VGAGCPSHPLLAPVPPEQSIRSTTQREGTASC
jgi:hypothetical protein